MFESEFEGDGIGVGRGGSPYLMMTDGEESQVAEGMTWGQVRGRTIKVSYGTTKNTGGSITITTSTNDDNEPNDTINNTEESSLEVDQAVQKDLLQLRIWQLVVGYNLRELEVRGGGEGF